MRIPSGLTGRHTDSSASARTVVVTGASSGIGRATTLRLADAGWTVFATVRREADADALTEAGRGRVRPVHLDLTNEESIRTAAHQVGALLGDRGLNGLVNNAGMGLMAPVEHVTRDQLERVYQVNVFGQIAVIQAFLPQLRTARGRIITIGSVGDHVSPPFSAALASPKAAIASVTGALRLELRADGVRVCLVEPASINTPAVEKTLGDIDGVLRSMPHDGAMRYGDAMRRMSTVFAAQERSGSAPEVVAAVIERALTERRPKVRYATGKDARKLTLMSRLLPPAVLDRAIMHTFGLSATAPERMASLTDG